MRIHAHHAAEWMRDNPGVMLKLEAYARAAIASGAGSVGIALLVERVRWYGRVEAKDKDGFKINNNHRAYIARELMRRNPDMAGLFETREVWRE